jgi:hypothetical protein
MKALFTLFVAIRHYTASNGEIEDPTTVRELPLFWLNLRT